MAKLVIDPMMNALRAAGVISENTSRVVFDIRVGHMPVVYTEQFGDTEQLIAVALTLSGIQIERR